MKKFLSRSKNQWLITRHIILTRLHRCVDCGVKLQYTALASGWNLCGKCAEEWETIRRTNERAAQQQCCEMCDNLLTRDERDAGYTICNPCAEAAERRIQYFERQHEFVGDLFVTSAQLEPDASSYEVYE